MPGAKDGQFDNEANHLMRLKHPNVVLLVGWCSETENIYVEYNGKYICAEKSERLLCLEYMPKGNLRGYLSDESSGLGWDTRYKIIEGICYGLRYLHEECQINAPIVHMDLKPANILLDSNMVPKIADFGLSRLFSEEKTWTCTRSRDGTLGYMSPEYINRGLISKKSDIFSLGVIIIEIVTGRRDYPDDTGTPSEEFIEMVLHNWSQRKGIKLLFGVSLEVDYQQIRRCIQIGLDCVKTDRSKRPTISQIIKALHRPENADSSNIKGVHRPQSGKRDRDCGETRWMERLAKKHTPGFSKYENFTVALHQRQKKTALRRIRVIFTSMVFVVLLKRKRRAVEMQRKVASSSGVAALPLTPDAAAVLSRAAADASRRHHAHITPLHVAAVLLSFPEPLLRDACAAGLAYPHPLRFRALELCFAATLDRLPTSMELQHHDDGGGGALHGARPLSKALAVALKRAYAHCRRYGSSGVGEPHLVLAILDDPSVARVMREASFSSRAVRAAMLRSLSVSDPAAAAPDVSRAREEEVSKVVQVLKRGKRRNPVLVGDMVDVDAVVQEVVALIQSQPLGNARVVSFPKEDMDRAQLTAKIKELGEAVRSTPSSAVVVANLGNLKWLVEEIFAANQGEEQEKRREVVLDAVDEMARVLNLSGEGEHRVWVIGTATCATYMKCQVYHPALESEWDLQAVPIIPRPPPPPPLPLGLSPRWRGELLRCNHYTQASPS